MIFSSKRLILNLSMPWVFACRFIFSWWRERSICNSPIWTGFNDAYTQEAWQWRQRCHDKGSLLAASHHAPPLCFILFILLFNAFAYRVFLHQSSPLQWWRHGDVMTLTCVKSCYLLATFSNFCYLLATVFLHHSSPAQWLGRVMLMLWLWLVSPV